MLFQKKPLLYFEFLERRIRYLVMDAQSRTILEKNEILFDTEILHEGRIINQSLLENRLNALVTEKNGKMPKHPFSCRTTLSSCGRKRYPYSWHRQRSGRMLPCIWAS